MNNGIPAWAPVSHQETIAGQGSRGPQSIKGRDGRERASASLILSRSAHLTVSSLALRDNIGPAIIPGFVACWLCSAAHLARLCLRIGENENERGEWPGGT